ncbi:MAG: dTMP kinase [Candidatus Paceibacteria bacterium]|jgi:dTMP kinase
MKGKLIVIDGGDGAGKATQVALLVKRLMAEGHKVETLDFPQYSQNTFGKLLRECLDGKRGDFMTVDARIASTLYAADRFESKPRLEQWLNEGKVIVLDRYVSANMMHQGAKIADVEKLESFLGWLDHMEHDVFGVPRPDQIVYLEVPNTVRVALKAQAVDEGKHGLAVKLDVAERNHEHQEATEERARLIVSSKNNWTKVSCCVDNEMRTREDIHEDTYKAVSAVI